MALLKFCSRCNKTIPYGKTLCEECEAKVKAKKKVSTEKDKERYRRYKANRTDNMYQEFYQSKGWRLLRSNMTEYYFNMCVWSYYEYGVIKFGNQLHHIVEIKDDFSKRLDTNNVILLSQEAHQIIHEMYKYDKVAIQGKLKEYVERFKNEFRR